MHHRNPFQTNARTSIEGADKNKHSQKKKKKRKTPQRKIPKKEHVTMLTTDPEMKTKLIIMESNQMKSSQNDTFKRHQV